MKVTNISMPKLWTMGLALVAILMVSAPSTTFAQGVLYVQNDMVGIGTATPVSNLHVMGDDALYPQLFLLENIGSDFAGFRFATTGGAIDFNKAGGNTFRLNMVDGDSWELQLDPSGNLTIKGQIITAGSCSGGCDRVFSSNYGLPTIEEHAAAMWSLSHLPAVGATTEGQPFNLSDKTERILNELEVAHIFIDQLNSELNQKETRIADLEERLARLEGLIAK